jgi:hypothetical protein
VSVTYVAEVYTGVQSQRHIKYTDGKDGLPTQMFSGSLRTFEHVPFEKMVQLCKDKLQDIPFMVGYVPTIFEVDYDNGYWISEATE